MEAVFQTAELLENILVQLPPRKIFEIQRVSKSFKAAITASPPIQEKLFLRLRHKTKDLWSPSATEPGTWDRTSVPITMNPFFQDRYTTLDSPHGYSHERSCVNMDRNSFILESKSISFASSFFNMYVCDPTCHHAFSRLDYVIDGEHKLSHIEKIRRYDDADNVLIMRALVDESLAAEMD